MYSRAKLLSFPNIKLSVKYFLNLKSVNILTLSKLKSLKQIHTAYFVLSYLCCTFSCFSYWQSCPHNCLLGLSFVYGVHVVVVVQQVQVGLYVWFYVCSFCQSCVTCTVINKIGYLVCYIYVVDIVWDLSGLIWRIAQLELMAHSLMLFNNPY